MLVTALLSGLVLGGTYALIAMGLTLQYGVARIMNLCLRRDSMVAAAFLAFCALHRARGQSPGSGC
jgi:branched-chain amino acid transport system permease protein